MSNSSIDWPSIPALPLLAFTFLYALQTACLDNANDLDWLTGSSRLRG
ncbi:hypothetical protein [Xenorhabdus nematophila]|nr:hypothetical protein [Xenorhabdus nematophila]MCB4427192.1 hypothetical protein [Xenorhabdus nematophila]